MTDPRQRAAATKRERTRRALIGAATVLFNEQGYEATSIEDIATRAGVGVATAYNYFSTKDRLPAECLSPLLDELGESADHDVQVGTDTVVAVTRHVTDAARILHQHRPLVIGFMAAYMAHQDRTNAFAGAADLHVWNNLSEPLADLLATSFGAAASEISSFYMEALVMQVIRRRSRSAREIAGFVLSQLMPKLKPADA